MPTTSQAETAALRAQAASEHNERVRAAEREACAKVLREWGCVAYDKGCHCDGCRFAREAIAAIRAMGDIEKELGA